MNQSKRKNVREKIPNATQSNKIGNLEARLNPHAFQNTSTKYTDNFTRILKDDFPELKYRPRQHDEDRSTVHYGQRKLHLSEIEFLTNFCKDIPEMTKKVTLIYAGAAPGTHIAKLSSMFPFINFVLVDPAPFIVKATKNIETIQDFFTDRMAEEMVFKYKDDLRLFISDIRLNGPGIKKKVYIRFCEFQKNIFIQRSKII